MQGYQSMKWGVLVLGVALAVGCGTSGTMSEVAPKLGQFTSDAAGFDTHSYYLATSSEVVVFDAQFTEAHAEALLAQIRSETDAPITKVVVTHPNPDKFNGAAVFQREGAEVIASSATAAAIAGVHAYKKYYFVDLTGMFTEETYPAEATVDTTFDGRLEVVLGSGATLELVELEHSGVSSTQTVAWIPGVGALLVGDLVHHGAHAWLEGGIVDGQPAPDLAQWRDALTELLTFEGATVYGGRGESAPVAEAVSAQQAYLESMEALVSDYLSELEDPAAALASDAAPEHFAAITERASAAHPDRGLSYLVEFGVYGLAGHIAAGL